MILLCYRKLLPISLLNCMKGLFGRLAGFLGGPWGMAIGIALPLVADYLPRLIDSLNMRFLQNIIKHTTREYSISIHLK